ncbi:MAG: signal peptidase I, partial [Flavobacteriaceae bacterium]
RKTFYTQSTLKNAKKAVIHPNVVSMTFNAEEEGVRDSRTFPQNSAFDWNSNYFGPLWIPKSGETLDLTLENLPVYKR